MECRDWFQDASKRWLISPLKRGLARNDGGVWGEDFDDDGTIVLRSTDVAVDGSWRIEQPARRRLSCADIKKGTLVAGDLLVTKSSGSEDHLGKTALVSTDVETLGCCFSNFMQRLRPNGRLDSGFLFWFLNSSMCRDQINYLGTTTTGLANLSGSLVGRLTCVFPPLEEQRKIADFLDRETAKIDDLLRQKEEFVRLTEETRRSIVARAVTRGIRGAHLKPSGVKWFGDIPQHWSTNRLGRLAEEINDVNHEMPEAVADGVPFLSAKDLKDDGSLNFTEDIKLISRSDFLRLSAKIKPKRGDIVYSRYGACLGKARLVENDREFLVSYSCVIIRLRQNVADPRFFSYSLDSDLVLTEARLRTQGIAVPDLGNKMIAKFTVPVPPLSEQREIAAWLDEKVSALRQLADAIALGIKKVRELRASLISAAVTGQIDVRTYRPQEAAALCQ